MLQQTTVAATIPYYERFLIRFPTMQALAAAPLEDVLAAWAGLGYYARARNLHACARAVVMAGGFPRDLAGLRALPGIGGYTAAAIGAIAFGVPAVPVDGNVERVVARLFAVGEELPAAKPSLRSLAAQLGDDPAAQARPSDFAQALFDLGATVCTPAAPACGLCPWMAACAGPSRRHCRRVAAQVREACAAVAAWRAFLAHRRRRQRAVAAAPAGGAARWHDGTAGHRLAPGAVDSGGGATTRADASRLASGWARCAMASHISS